MSQTLSEKWAPVLSHEDMPSIKDTHKKSVIAQVLENTETAIAEETHLTEASNSGFGTTGQTSYSTAGVPGRAGYDPILISLVRRAMPQMMAFDVTGVQPMSAPTGLIFAMKAVYDNTQNAATGANEALYNEAGTRFSGAAGKDVYTVTAADATANTILTEGDLLVGVADSSAAQALTATTLADARVQTGNQDPFATDSASLAAGYDVTGGAAGTTASGKTTADGEGDSFREMSFSIEKTAVVAKTRALKSEYTMELVQDLKAVHGLDAEAELANILSTEILAEINREVVHTINSQAVLGCKSGSTTTTGIFDLVADGQGRWSVERQKGLMLQLEKEANEIAFSTRRGKGNFIMCSANVASALTMAGLLDYSSALEDNLNIDVTSGTFAGVLNGRTKVYIDPYAVTGDYITVGYKGANAMDAGLFYCPYVPLQMVRAVNQDNFQPKIGFKTRYGMVSNPFANPAAVQANGLVASRTNVYYRIFKVLNV